MTKSNDTEEIQEEDKTKQKNTPVQTQATWNASLTNTKATFVP